MLDCVYKLLFSFSFFDKKILFHKKTWLKKISQDSFFNIISFSLVVEFSIFEQQISQELYIKIKNQKKKNNLSKNI